MIIAELIQILRTLDPEHQVSICGDETFTLLELPESNMIIFDHYSTDYDEPYKVLHGVKDDYGWVNPT